MMSKRVDIQLRKDRVLSLAIDEYIITITPVSSSLLAQQYFPELSSATIRNILAELEQEGFLTHPHTSAGRVPTQKGYRYYVDNLMKEIKLLEDEKQHIKKAYHAETLELEYLLETTSQIMSHTTHYTSIISVDGWGNKFFCKGTDLIVDYPEYQSLQKIKAILQALEEKEHLLEVINQDLKHKIGIYIGHEITCSQINNCSLVVSSFETRHGPTGRMAILGPTRMDYKRVVSTIGYFSQLIKEMF
ncbi:MAG: hypothetical protein K8S27_10960 [Candidatus Omnitrophica bacterium]|nr:hypothetical protein [Candidatus Omnitrophota bacterium]